MADALVSWPTFFVALIVYGLAPGLLLRIILLAFHRDDPRRKELHAELYHVPRLIRPFWVLEQVEAALFDGVFPRIAWAATGRIIHRWHLDSGLDFHRRSPDTFWIPDEEAKMQIVPGDTVKLMFHMKNGFGERMWVNVTEAKSNGKLVGVLANTPAGIPRLDPGKTIKFHRDDIIDIQTEPIEGDTSVVITRETTEDDVEIWCACCNDHTPRAGLSGPEGEPES